MPDLALVLAEAGAEYVADLTLIDDDLSTDGGLLTALLLSLYTDRRAEPDDDIPDGTGDRRGWWADEFLEDDGDQFGSRLWLLDRTTNQVENAIRARAFIAEATQWLIDDRVLDEIEIEVEQLDQGALCYSVRAVRPDATDTQFRFPHVWNQSYAV